MQHAPATVYETVDTWLNEPSDWTVEEDGSVSLAVEGRTDMWRYTEGTAPKHDGHVLGHVVDGHFAVELTVDATLASRYDQIGVFLRSSETRWLKAGIELDGEVWINAAHTRDESDWSRELGGALPATLRVERGDHHTVIVSIRRDDAWHAYRILSLPGPLFVGPYACAPSGNGFRARFVRVAFVTARRALSGATPQDSVAGS